MEKVLLYDGTIEGFFTAIFEVYERKLQKPLIRRLAGYEKGLFEVPFKVISDEVKSTRVLKGLRKVTPRGIIEMLIKVLHSELPDAEHVALEVVQLAFAQPKGLRMDYRNEAILRMKEIHRMMNREIHRMHAFVRFQKTADDIYAATITPDFDVMPFIGSHFEKRYADQQWLIYDTGRNYGIFYNLKRVNTIVLKNPLWVGNKQISPAILSENEPLFKDAWATYFHATCIQERKNMRLHLQHVPHRYWNHLPEKTRSL
ncbi:MAG: TIGR03915 family putative DNA repair protein [Bacteroidota bacterium]